MPEPFSYRSHLSLEAAAYLISLPRRRQRRLLDLADQLSQQPFRTEEGEATDAEGRIVHTLLLDGYLFCYWVDHASREVRITEIIRL